MDIVLAQRTTAVSKVKLGLYSATGIAIGCAFVFLFAIASSLFLTQERLAHVVRHAFAHDDLPSNPRTSRTEEDFFTECAMLQMQFLRDSGVILGAAVNRWHRTAPHPCETLRTMLAAPEEKPSSPRPGPYVNYAFGSRHLEAVVLSLFEFGTARGAYKFISYLSVVLLAIAAWRSASRTAAVLLPIALFLLFGFSLHRFGDNLAHAPGFMVGLLALSLLLALQRRFDAFSSRLLFFGLLGVITSYFDLLHGAFPTVLSLSLIVNYFFFIDRRGEPAAGLLMATVSQTVAIAVTFLAAYVVLAAVRIACLAALGISSTSLWHDIAYRLANTTAANTIVTFGDVARSLWGARSQMTAAGSQTASWLLLIGGASWLYALWSLAVNALARSGGLTQLALHMAVLVAAAAVIIGWYWRLPVHTIEHSAFIVRTVALPAAYGLVAAISATLYLINRRHDIRWASVTALVSVFLMANVLHRTWSSGQQAKISLARFVTEGRNDLVSCAPLGMRPDGQPDGIVEISYRLALPPMTLLGLRRATPTKIRLVREGPPGVYETGGTYFVLGIAEELQGALLNRSDGTLGPVASDERHLFAHFCMDGHDTADTEYRAEVEGGVARVVGAPIQ